MAAVYTPKDYGLTAILADIVEIVDWGDSGGGLRGCGFEVEW